MDFLDLLVGYETRLWNHLDGVLRQTDAPSLATVAALRVVQRHGDACRVQEVRVGLSITVGAASKLVDRLERDGLVVRRAHPTDRRSAIVALTEQGQAAVATGNDVLGRALAEHLRDQPDLTSATEVLSQLDARLAPAAARA